VEPGLSAETIALSSLKRSQINKVLKDYDDSTYFSACFFSLAAKSAKQPFNTSESLRIVEALTPIIDGLGAHLSKSRDEMGATGGEDSDDMRVIKKQLKRRIVHGTYDRWKAPMN
jgi:hypothetical protein